MSHNVALEMLRRSRQRYLDIAALPFKSAAGRREYLDAAASLQASIETLEQDSQDPAEAKLEQELGDYRDHLVDQGVDSAETRLVMVESFRTGWERHSELSIRGTK